MKNDIMEVPEGYFEQSYRKTMKRAAGIRAARRSVFASCLACVLVAGAVMTVRHAGIEDAQREYITMQQEIMELDVFMEVN